MNDPPQFSGGTYVPLCDRDNPPNLLRSATNMWLLGPVLTELDSKGKLPLRGDVLRYVRGRQTAEKKGQKLEKFVSCPQVTHSSSISCSMETGCQLQKKMCAVAAVKADSWLASKIPLVSDKTIRDQIIKDYKLWENARKNRNKMSVHLMEERNNVMNYMNSVFDISKADAEEIIMKDRQRSDKAKEEDINFLKEQLTNGMNRVSRVSKDIDLKYLETVNKKMAKVEAFEKQKEKEEVNKKYQDV